MPKIDIDFNNEIKLIENEIKNNDNFYKESKEHFDNIKKSRSSGTLSFVHLQTANLISLKGNKLDLIKELINIKKLRAELTIKNKTDETEDSTVYKNVAMNFFDAIIKNRKDVSFDSLLINEKENEKNSKPVEQDENIDKLLDKRLEEAQEKDKVKEKKSVDNIKYMFVTDKNGTIYCLDKDYNILEDMKIPDWKIKFKGKGDNMTATNQYDENVEIIEFEED